MENSLADTYRDVIGSVGFEAGWGRGPDNGDEVWDDQKLATLKYVVKSGLRQFYGAHEWSFLQPRIELSLPSGTRELAMPFDFGGLEGKPHLVAPNAGRGKIEVTNDVRARYAMYPNAAGRPMYAEIEPLRATNKERGQRWQMIFYPQPNSDYTVEMYYTILGTMLSGDVPYAYGGAEHSETILASCLAVWENRIDDIPPGPQSPRYAAWTEQLALSIRRDQKKQPQMLGYNRDASDRYERRAGRRIPRDYGWTPLRLNGVLYD